MGGKHFTDAQITEILDLYKADWSQDQIAAHLGKTQAGVWAVLHRSGVRMRKPGERAPALSHKGPPRKLDAEQETMAATLYAAGQTQTQIGAATGAHQMTISRNLRRMGVKIRSNSEARTTCSLRRDAFDILTPDAAYWCGFIFTDGTVITRPAGQGDIVGVHISAGDRGHLVKLRDFLGSTHAITSAPAQLMSVHNGRTYMARPTCALTVSSQQLADRLRSLGRYEGPISPELAASLDFWRGAVDGDGSLGLYRNSYKPPPAVYPRVELVGASRLLDVFLAFLASHGMAGRMTVRPRKNHNIHVVATTGRPVPPIVDLLYRDAVVALGRKALRAARIIAGRT